MARPVNSAFIPIAGFMRFENSDDVCAFAVAGAHSSATSRHASVRILMGHESPDHVETGCPNARRARRAQTHGGRSRAGTRHQETGGALGVPATIAGARGVSVASGK